MGMTGFGFKKVAALRASSGPMVELSPMGRIARSSRASPMSFMSRKRAVSQAW
jgi:hypothetical protein